MAGGDGEAGWLDPLLALEPRMGDRLVLFLHDADHHRDLAALREVPPLEHERPLEARGARCTHRHAHPAYPGHRDRRWSGQRNREPAAAQLRADYPYLSGGRLDTSGRNYGQLSIDPARPGLISLVAGTSVSTYYRDMVANRRGTRVSSPSRSVALILTPCESRAGRRS